MCVLWSVILYTFALFYIFCVYLFLLKNLLIINAYYECHSLRDLDDFMSIPRMNASNHPQQNSWKHCLNSHIYFCIRNSNGTALILGLACSYLVKVCITQCMLQSLDIHRRSLVKSIERGLSWKNVFNFYCCIKLHKYVYFICCSLLTHMKNLCPRLWLYSHQKIFHFRHTNLVYSQPASPTIRIFDVLL